MQKLCKILIFLLVFLSFSKSDNTVLNQSQLKQDSGINNETGDTEFTNIDSSTQVVKDSLKAINQQFEKKMHRDSFASLQQFQDYAFMEKLLKIYQIRTYKDDEKKKSATHLLMYFTIQNLKSFQQLKYFLYNQECQTKIYGDLRKIPENRKEQPIADFTYYQYHRGMKIFERWFDFKNVLFQFLQDNPDLDNVQDIAKVINWQDYTQLMDEFTEYYLFIEQQTKYVNCGMANFLHFYNLVYRFAYTIQGVEYKNNLSTDQTFQQLYEESQIFYKQIFDSFMHRFYFMYFWAVLMEQLYFLVKIEQDSQRYFIEKLISLLLYFDQPIKYSGNKLQKIEAYCVSNYESVKNLLSRVEQSLKSDDRKLRKEYKTLEQIEHYQSGNGSEITKILLAIAMIFWSQF